MGGAGPRRQRHGGGAAIGRGDTGRCQGWGSTQPFLVDLDVGFDLEAAAANDDLAATASYATLAQLATDILAGPPVHLIETLAGQVADAVLCDARVEFVQVTVHKPAAPMDPVIRDASVTLRRERCRDGVVALGANLGERARTLATALADLDAMDGVRVRAVSNLVESDPVGPPQPDYLNAVALISTRRHPQSVLRELHAVEARHKRRRGLGVEPNGPRTLDLDLIQVGDPAVGTDVSGRYGALELPHPRAHCRGFVLAPWYEVDPQATLRTPHGVREVGELLQALPAVSRESLRPGPDWPTRPWCPRRPERSPW